MKDIIVNSFWGALLGALSLSILIAIANAAHGTRSASTETFHYMLTKQSIVRDYCEIDTIETHGESPWCEKYHYDDLEYCYCMKDDPIYSWGYPWEK